VLSELRHTENVSYHTEDSNNMQKVIKHDLDRILQGMQNSIISSEQKIEMCAAALARPERMCIREIPRKRWYIIK